MRSTSQPAVRLAFFLVFFAGVVDAQIPANLTITSATPPPYQATNTITTSGAVTVGGTASTTYLAGNRIILNPGFTAYSGSVSPSFVAMIGTPGGTPDFSIIEYPLSQTIAPGGYATFGFTVTPANGFNQNISLAASGLPPGATLSPSTIAGQGTTPVTITTQSSSPVNAYNATVTASGGAASHQVPLTLGINTPITGPSSLQANLGPIPLDVYDFAHAPSNYELGSGCSNYSTVRGCFQGLLANYRAQGVTGVRIAFTLCGGFYSTPLGNCGSNYTLVTPPSPSGAWAQNLQAFYSDVYNAGIPNVALWVVFGDYIGTFGTNGAGLTAGTEYLATQPSGSYTPPNSPSGPVCSIIAQNGYTALQYVPTLPYPQVACHNAMPYAQQPTVPPAPPDMCQLNAGLPLDDGDHGYNCSPINPNFVGWNNFYAVINLAIREAYNTPTAGAKGLNVFEFEVQSEINPFQLPVMARFIVDNARTDTGNGDVLSSVRASMSNFGYDPGRVTYGASIIRTFVAGSNCLDVYGDYSRLYTLDAIYSAIEGGFIGLPANWTTGSGGNTNLICGGTTTPQGPMFRVTTSHSAPDIVDAHNYPCVANQSQGGCETTISTANVQQEAQISFDDITHFIQAYASSSLFVLGETFSNSTSQLSKNFGLNCELNAPPNSAALTVAGYNASSQAGQSVVFRPWDDPSFVTGCFIPSNLNVNVAVQGNLGPYTPTQH